MTDMNPFQLLPFQLLHCSKYLIIIISVAYLALSDVHACSGSDPAHFDGMTLRQGVWINIAKSRIISISRDLIKSTAEITISKKRNFFVFIYHI